MSCGSRILVGETCRIIAPEKATDFFEVLIAKKMMVTFKNF